MDKSWLSKARVSTAYRNGVESFLNFAFAKSAEGNEILCPCVKCKNMFWQTRNVVNEHLICHGFVKKYSIWTFNKIAYQVQSTKETNMQRTKLLNKTHKAIYMSVLGRHESGNPQKAKTTRKETRKRNCKKSLPDLSQRQRQIRLERWGSESYCVRC
ncbi:unnamed protein product [Linum tenue]|nr:unnamed protein product [Linum tenue]